MPSASYLQPLVAPLRFLAQSDFARLSTVKGLEGLVRTALEGALAAGSVQTWSCSSGWRVRWSGEGRSRRSRRSVHSRPACARRSPRA